MKKSLFFLFFIIYNNCYCQLINKELENHKHDIVIFLKNNEQIINPNKADSIYFKQIYTRKIQDFKKGTSFYEIGITASHSLKFLAVYKNRSFEIFPTENFNNEFVSILSKIDSNNNDKKIIPFLLIIKGIYDYNANPSWKLPWK